MFAISTRQGKLSILQVELPEQGPVNLGVLLEDPERDALFLRLRRDLDSFAGGDDLDVLAALADDLSSKAAELGAGKLFEYLESTLSGSIRVTDREPVLVEDFPRALDRLYRRHVESNVQKFRTHLPRYSLQVAAGEFLENREVADEGWVEAPENLRLDKNMFVAQIAGHSMEPLIPDGSLCVFRRGVVGSREGRLVLVEDAGSPGNDRYTVKRYKRETGSSGQEWRHTRIWLEPLNAEFNPIELKSDEDRYRVIAEFVRVLD